MSPPQGEGTPSNPSSEPGIGGEQLARLGKEGNEGKIRDSSLRRAETALWLFIGIGFYLFRYQSVMSALGSSVANTFFDLFLAALIVLIPIVFQLVFQVLPLEAVRLRYSRRGSPFEVAKATQVRAARYQVGFPPGETIPPSHNSILLLQDMAERSDSIAEKIYTRAGVYLLFGVMIAFSGLGFFYLETRASNAPSPIVASGLKGTGESQPMVHQAYKTPMEALASMMPPLLGRIGVLFFIELVAFFFLRQYRAAMDEYRYFEAIKRRREENLATASMLFQTGGDKIDFFAFITKCSLYSDIPKLAAGETTEILESRKLTKDETALFEKMIEAIARVRAS